MVCCSVGGLGGWSVVEPCSGMVWPRFGKVKAKPHQATAKPRDQPDVKTPPSVAFDILHGLARTGTCFLAFRLAERLDCVLRVCGDDDELVRCTASWAQGIRRWCRVRCEDSAAAFSAGT